MPPASCTRLACFLQENGKIVSFPLVTLAGLVDGINPCAIGMMIMLVGYLIIFRRRRRRELIITGAFYILTVFLTYLLIGLGFYHFFSKINLAPARNVINKTFVILLFSAGLIQIKDAFWPGSPIHLRIPNSAKKRLQTLIVRATIPAAVALAFLVTVLETPCSLPLYLGTASILAQSGFGLPVVIGYFLYYNLLFILPLIVVLMLISLGYNIAQVKEWEHKNQRWMKLSLGILLLIFAILLAWG